MFVVGLLLIVAAIVILIAGARSRRRRGVADTAVQGRNRTIVASGAGAAALLGVVLVGASSAYAQDTGDASVIVSWTGDILGQETTPGVHVKAPWSEVKTFSVRNQQVVFAGDRATTDYTGGSAQGPDIHGPGRGRRHQRHRHRGPLLHPVRSGDDHLQAVP